jgi:hypothetical protein
MATDAQGRQLSPDGNYYWDGSNWQLVGSAGGDSSEGGDASASSQQSAATDAQGRQLSQDGNHYWDGSNWQPVDVANAAGLQQAQYASDSGAGVPGDIAVSMQDEVAAPDGEIALSELEPLPQQAIS